MRPCPRCREARGRLYQGPLEDDRAPEMDDDLAGQGFLAAMVAVIVLGLLLALVAYG